MSITAAAIFMMLGSSLSWGAFDALRKVLVVHVRSVPLTALLALGQLPFFLCWILLTGAQGRVAATYALWGMLSIAINTTASILFIKSLELSPLSATIPFLSFTPVFTALFSVPLLGEVPLPAQILGILLVVCGAFLLNLRRSDALSLRGILSALSKERGSILMMGVALLWSFSAAVDKRALVHAPVSIHAAVQCAGIALFLLLFLKLRAQTAELEEIGKTKGAYVAAVLAGSAALGLQLLAVKLVLVSIVESVKRAIGMTMSVVNGRLFFNEPLTVGKTGGVLLMGIGVALILL